MNASLRLTILLLTYLLIDIRLHIKAWFTQCHQCYTCKIYCRGTVLCVGSCTVLEHRPRGPLGQRGSARVTDAQTDNV